MSQHDFDVADAAGSAFLADLNLSLKALGSLSSGSSAPSTTYSYQWWLDTGNSVLKMRNGANSAWVTMPMSISTGLIALAGLDTSMVVTAAETIASNNNDTTLPTSAAVKAYADSAVPASNPIVSASEPGTMYSGLIWQDSSVTPNLVKVRDTGNNHWIDFYKLHDASAANENPDVLLGSGSTFPAGHIVQIVSLQLPAAIAFTSTSFADISGVTLAITPSATSSKIWIQGHLNWGLGTNNATHWRLLRDSTVIGDTTINAEDSIYATGINLGYSVLRTVPFSFIDSPSTTSSVTYKVMLKIGAGTLYINRIGASTGMASSSSINLLEVLA